MAAISEYVSGSPEGYEYAADAVMAVADAELTKQQAYWADAVTRARQEVARRPSQEAFDFVLNELQQENARLRAALDQHHDQAHCTLNHSEER